MRNIFYAILSILCLAGCSPSKNLVFANRDWHISDYYGQIIDRDTTYRMTFGEGLIPRNLMIISSEDSVVKYPGLHNFMADILHTVMLDSAEILFYTPELHTMFVRLNNRPTYIRPASITCNLSADRPYTMWIYPDDKEDWIRLPDEMYTYTFFSKRKKRILIVDYFNYGDIPVARIAVLQSQTKTLRNIAIPSYMYNVFLKHDLRNYEADVEFWSNIIDGHRKLAIANFKIGQEQKQKR